MLSQLQEGTISFVIPVCRLSVHPRGITQLPLDGFFMKFDIRVFLKKIVEKIQVSLQSDKNNGSFI